MIFYKLQQQGHDPLHRYSGVCSLNEHVFNVEGVQQLNAQGFAYIVMGVTGAECETQNEKRWGEQNDYDCWCY